MPARAKSSAADTFDAIMERAERRGRVVLEVEMDGVRVKLAPPERAEVPAASSAPGKPEPGSPMDDPSTYGGAVPGFKRPQEGP